jgi:hypothetical protein
MTIVLPNIFDLLPLLLVSEISGLVMQGMNLLALGRTNSINQTTCIIYSIKPKVCQGDKI